MTTASLVSLEDLNNKAFVTDFVRLLQFPQFILDQFLPQERIPGIQYRWNTTPLYQEPAVTYRAWDVETQIGSRPGVQRSSAELPPLGKKKIMTEEHTIRLEALQSGEWGPYVQTAFDDLSNLTQGVHSRWELDRATLLSTGALTVSGPDNGSGATWSQSIDYGVPSGNKVTASPLWSSVSTADPLLDLTTWVAAYRLLNRGLTPGVVLISQTILANLLRNTALRSLLYFGAANTAPTVLPITAVQNELQARGLPRIIVVDEQLTDSSGSFGYALPQNKAILLPDPATGLYVGKTVLGVTAQALGMVESGTITTQDSSGIVAQSWIEDDPAQRYNMVNAVGMPVISNPNLLMIATVG